MSLINEAIPRLEKAYEILESIRLLGNSKAIYENDSKIYHIDFDEETCECPDHKFRAVKCKHIWASQIKHRELLA